MAWMLLIKKKKLFKNDGLEYCNLTPWYATMYVKSIYRGKFYSKILNDAMLNKAKQLGYNKVYLKSNLVNYYERFGAKKISKLKNGENLYYINLIWGEILWKKLL